MTRFLLDVGALTEQEVDQTLEMVHVGLRDAITAAADPDLPSRTGARVRELIAHALRTGLAYVDDVRTGEAASASTTSTGTCRTVPDLGLTGSTAA